MKTLDISYIEKLTGKKIRRNCISVGFDVAPAYTGICILKTNTSKLYIESSEVIKGNPKEDHLHRIDHYEASLYKFKQSLDQYKNKYKLLIIEGCFFGKNAQTLIKLAHFGAVTYVTLKKNFDVVYYWGATTARSMIKFSQKKQQSKTTIKPKLYTRDTKDKKGKIKHHKGEEKPIECKTLVHDYLKTDFGVEFDTPDEADAFVLSLSGLLK